jgi:hypothetical protein
MNAGVGAHIDTPSVLKKLTQVVSSRGWTLGYDPDRDRFVVIGIGYVNAEIGDDGYLNARRLAWQSAMQNARQEFVNFMAARVTSSVTTSYEEKDGEVDVRAQAAAAEAAANPSATDKIVMLIHSDLDKRLQADGIDMDTDAGRGRAKARAEVLMSTASIQSAVKVAATSEAAGLQVVETYESTKPGAKEKTEIGIIAIYSAKSRQMSGALLGKAQAPTGKAKMTIEKWLNSLSDEQLMYTQGVQQRTDEKGNICLIAFGQGAPKTTGQNSIGAARKKAYLNAMQDLRDFAGTKVVSNLLNEGGATLKEYSASERYNDESYFSSQIESIGKPLVLAGAAQTRPWEFFHPLESRKPMVGTVVVWNTQSSEAAQALKKVLEKNGGSFGGFGHQGSESTVGAGAGSGTPNPGDDGSGVSGDDDDI